MASNKTYRIRLVIGDWSGDGHEKTSDIWIESSLSKTKLQAAYNKGLKVVGEDFKELCEDYEDSSISDKQVERLRVAGFDIATLKDGDEYCLWAETYAAIWLFIASKGDPMFKWTEIKAGDDVNIGGYGLFH